MKKIIKIIVVILVISMMILPLIANAQDTGGKTPVTPPPASDTTKTDEQKAEELMNDTSKQWECPAEIDALKGLKECIEQRICDVDGKNCKGTDERTKYIITPLEESIAGENVKGDKNEIRQCTRVIMDGNCKWIGDSAKAPPEAKSATYTKIIDGIKCPSGALRCERVTYLLAKTGTGVIEMYVGLIYRWAASLAGIVCILIMIVSGIQISAAGEDTQGVESAKKRIFQSLTALVILFMSALILYMINPDFFTL
ncbi:hypothetical protein HZA39_00560 [Candidatus Peregrinibacteria bacterium]|nr:hypothetical protein [Candidatus Peregrinibacteria bacterium]